MKQEWQNVNWTWVKDDGYMDGEWVKDFIIIDAISECVKISVVNAFK